MNRLLLLAISIVLVIGVFMVRAALEQSIRVEPSPVRQIDNGIGNPVEETAEIIRSNLLSVRSVDPAAGDTGSATSNIMGSATTETLADADVRT